jgi:succinate-semialdehyde dehydrogenase/glutarate-semialdehyde dehydrogenase
VGAALVVSGVDMVVFTGSVATGRRVAAACGERLIPCIAELGGKDAAIVLADADLGHAARTVVLTAFFNAGQACASAERVLVHESVAEAFTHEVLEATRSLRVGDPVAAWPEQVDVGAITLPHHAATLEAQVAEAVARGARVLAGGHALRIGGGSYFAPTVLTNVPADTTCWREETFGPLLPIRTFTSEDEAVAIANAGPYGLNAYVFSRSVPHAEDVANRISAGCVIVNDFMWHHGAPEVPWGGWKQSGLGRVHGGRAGLRNFCEPRYVGLPRLGYAPGRFPYDERLLGFYDRVVGRWLLRGPWSRWL